MWNSHHLPFDIQLTHEKAEYIKKTDDKRYFSMLIMYAVNLNEIIFI